jgi:hypothetical protein
MKKIAILVFGKYGDFDTAVKFWDFKDQIDCDFYFSTWDITRKNNDQAGYNNDFKRKVTLEMITDYIPNAVVSLQNELEYNGKRYGVYEYDYGPSQEKLIHHWKECLRLVEESGKKYNQIMLIRPDMVHRFYFPIEELYQYNKKDRIYNHTGGITKGEKGNYVNDTFFIGDFETMSNMIKTFPDEATERANHWDTADHILSCNIFVEHIENIDPILLRPNVSLLKEEEKTIENFQKYFKIWLGEIKL